MAGPGQVQTLLVGIIYHTPGTEMLPITNVIARACSDGLPLLLLGDFNAHHTSWQQDTKIDQYGTQLHDCILLNQLSILNTLHPSSRGVHTYVGKRANGDISSVLDLAITNRIGMFTGCTVDNQQNSSLQLRSDHFPVIVTAQRSKHRPTPKQPRQRWNMQHAEWHLYRQLANEYYTIANDTISSIEQRTATRDVTPGDGMESIWSSILQLLDNASQPSVPQTKVPPNANPWWKRVANADQLLREMHQAHRKWLRNRNNQRLTPQERKELHNESNRTYREWKKLSNQAKKDNWHEHCAKTHDEHGRLNWRAFQRTTGSGKRASIEGIVGADGRLPRDGQAAVNNMAAHLAAVCSIPDDLQYDKKWHDKITRDVEEYANDASVGAFDGLFTHEEVRRVLSMANPNSALGPDNVHAMLLREAPSSLVGLFMRCFNYSWTHGVLPMDWRRADVCVIPKDGAPINDVNSYRPISLTSLVVKAMERLVLGRITAQLDHKLQKTQAGFRRKRSTVDNIYCLLSAIKTQWSDGHKPFVAAFLDFSKAFDRTWHTGVLWKCHQFGIKGRAWRWIRAFLTDRQMRVVSNGYYSSWYNITAGVPQGAVISPLLFIIFIDDLVENDAKDGIYINSLLFADDIIIWNPMHSRAAMEKILVHIVRWTYKWKMVLNGGKSGLMSFVGKRYLSRIEDEELLPIIIEYADHKWWDREQHPRRPPPSIIFEYVDKYKYLGVTLTRTLNWHAHAKTVLAKARYASMLIRRIIYYNRPPGVLAVRTIVCATIIPIITYAWPLWKCPAAIVHKLRSAIVQPLRRVLGLPATCHFHSVMVELAIPNLKVMYYRSAIKMFDRFLRLPASHHVHHYLEREGWSWREHGPSPAKRHWTAIAANSLGFITPIITGALKSILPVLPSVTTIKKTNWLESKWCTAVNTICLQLSRCMWSRLSHGSHIRGLWANVPRNKPFTPSYIYNDNRTLVTHRARMRMDRTQLKQASLRHDRRHLLGNDGEDICEWCDDQLVDDLDHYLYNCKCPELVNARRAATSHMWYPTIINAGTMANLLHNVIIAFTDGSCLKNKQAGAGALITLPRRSNIQQYSRRGQRDHIRYVSQRLGHRLPKSVDPESKHPAPVHYDTTKYISEHYSYGHESVHPDSMPIPNGTNNIAELYAVGIAINIITTIINEQTAAGEQWSINHQIMFAMDSKYSIGVLDQGHTPIANHKIITELHRRLQQLSNHGHRRITFQWVKAHDGIAGNEVADQLAGAASSIADITQLMPPLPPMVPIINDIHVPTNQSYPAKDHILGVYLPNYGHKDVERMLVATGHYITELNNVRPI